MCPFQMEKEAFANWKEVDTFAHLGTDTPRDGHKSNYDELNVVMTQDSSLD